MRAHSAGIRQFAFEYFEVDIDPAALEHGFALGPTTDHLVQKIVPAAGFDDLSRELASSDTPPAGREKAGLR